MTMYLKVHLKGGSTRRARDSFPENYGTAVEALERYLNYFGTAGDGTAMYGDLIDLFEQAGADETPIRQIVGEDPVEFVETFVQNYPKGQWIIRERERLINAIDRAAGEHRQRREAV
jgi:DNA-binding ferritin-like protein (Dps family)